MEKWHLTLQIRNVLRCARYNLGPRIAIRAHGLRPCACSRRVLNVMRPSEQQICILGLVREKSSRAYSLPDKAALPLHEWRQRRSISHGHQEEHVHMNIGKEREMSWRSTTLPHASLFFLLEVVFSQPIHPLIHLFRHSLSTYCLGRSGSNSNSFSRSFTRSNPTSQNDSDCCVIPRFQLRRWPTLSLVADICRLHWCGIIPFVALP